MEEPSVWDYVKSKLMPWKGIKIILPPPESSAEETDKQLDLVDGVISSETAEIEVDQPTVKKAEQIRLPWRSLGALLLAILAQLMLDTPSRSEGVAVAGYILAAGLAIWAILSREWTLPEIPEPTVGEITTTFRARLFLLSLPLLLMAFITFGSGEYSLINLALWFLGAAFFVGALWISKPKDESKPNWRERISAFARDPKININLSGFAILLVLVFLVAAYFRFSQLNTVPGEMFSDQAEKLLDVNDVMSGQWKVFFTRNTGREDFQFYLTALIASLFNTGLSFISLKIGTTLAGFLTLPFIFLLGKEIGNKWVGLLATILCGIAYWPNVISRIGLRFPLYALFAAPVLYFMIKGLRRQDRNALLLSGLFLGIGLHGYSPFRVIPLVVMVGFAIYLLHHTSKGRRKQTILAFVLLALAALVIFLPLARYALDNPEQFNYRLLSRMGTTERDYPGSPVTIFLGNFWKGLIMPFYDDGQTWVNSIPGRPALDLISAALFFIGLIVVTARYIQRRNWVDLFLLVSIPLLMLSSTLSLAFPDENPSLVRSSGAIIPIFLIIAVGLYALLSEIYRRATGLAGKSIAVGLGVVLVFFSSAQNFDLTFNQFNEQYMSKALNTSEMGTVIKNWAQSVGSYDTAFVIPYPYWVDTRLVGMNAGNPLKDYAIQFDQLDSTKSYSQSLLFILKPEDTASIDKLWQLYPDGRLARYDAKLDEKDFLIFTTP